MLSWICLADFRHMGPNAVLEHVRLRRVSVVRHGEEQSRNHLRALPRVRLARAADLLATWNHWVLHLASCPHRHRHHEGPFFTTLSTSFQMKRNLPHRFFFTLEIMDAPFSSKFGDASKYFEALAKVKADVAEVVASAGTDTPHFFTPKHIKVNHVNSFDSTCLFLVV